MAKRKMCKEAKEYREVRREMFIRHDCPCAETCALQGALEKIGGKWKLPVLCSLAANGASRYNELLRNIRGVSNTMLSKTLREMEESGLIVRREYLEVPVRVEYELPDRARALQPILVELIRWNLKPREP